jgi:hypothetical protein
LLHGPSRPGRVPSSAGSPARARGKGRGSLRRRGRVALGQGRPGSRRGRGAQRGHVPYECNGFARYGSLLRGARRRTRDRREFRAHGLLVHVPPRSKGSSWTGCSPPANQARYAMDVHPGTNLGSLEHAKDQCREVRRHGVLRSSSIQRSRKFSEVEGSWAIGSPVCLNRDGVL